MPIKHKMYNGEVEMVYDPKKHGYTVGGVKLPSVTQITGIIDKPALIHWAVNQTADRIGELWQPERPYSEAQITAAIGDAKGARYRTSQRALNIGSQAHDWIEQYIKAKLFGFDPPENPDYPPVRNATDSFLEWESQHDVEYISSERKVFSREHMYSGTADIDFIVDEKRIAGDLKTSKGIYPEYKLQVAAYAAALAEEDGTNYDGLMIVRVPKDGTEVELEYDEDIAGHFSVFLSCLAIWRWKNNWGKE